MKCNCISRLYKEQELKNIENSMNITRYFIVIIVSIGIGFFGLRFYDNFSESSDLNTFLEEAYVISTLHNESSKDYQRLINFDELNRDEFESVSYTHLTLPTIYSV